LEDYDGGRDYADLKAFADENLKPQCSVANIELCEGDKKTMIEKFLSMSEDELTKLVEEEEKKMEDARTTFETEVEKLQETYMNLQAEMENTMAEVKKGGLGMMKSVLKSKEVPEAKEEL
jgi:uracil phosphoribosyltransferase